MDNVTFPTGIWSHSWEGIHTSSNQGVEVADTEIRKWIIARISSNTKGQNRLLRELLATHEETVCQLIPNKNVFMEKHRNLRNKYTHRDFLSEQQADYTKLYWHTECVLALSYLIVADLIGIDKQVATKALSTDSFKPSLLQKAAELYSADQG